MILTTTEIINILIITLLTSFIFSRSLIENFLIKGLKEQTKTALLILPFILIHELAHKIIGAQLGTEVTFAPAYVLLIIGILLRQLNIGLIFFTNSYISFQTTNYSTSALIGLAGPIATLTLLTTLILTKNITKKQTLKPILNQAIKINLFLFIFSILPLPGFDGSYLLPITYF